MDEKIIAVTKAVRYWPRPKPGQFKFGSFLGKIVVTDAHFLFLSRGGPGWDETLEHLMAGGLVGLVMNLATAGHTTRDLDLSALENKGSLRVPLRNIVGFEARRPFVLAYLTLQYQDEQGGLSSMAIVRESVSGKKDLGELEAVLREATGRGV